MMTPNAKEKAEELVGKYVALTPNIPLSFPKQCALICVEEMINQWEQVFHAYGIGYLGDAEARNDIEKSRRYKYLQSVKEEIQKL